MSLYLYLILFPNLKNFVHAFLNLIYLLFQRHVKPTQRTICAQFYIYIKRKLNDSLQNYKIYKIIKFQIKKIPNTKLDKKTFLISVSYNKL